MAEYFKVVASDLLVAGLSDKLVHELEDEEVALQALEMEEQKGAYIISKKRKAK